MAQPSKIPTWWLSAIRDVSHTDLMRLHAAVKAGGASVNDRNAVLRIWGRMLSARMTSDSRPSITWDVNKYYYLKKLYEEAVEKGYDEIRIDGHLLVVPYAKYLLEYLKNRLDDEGRVAAYGQAK